MAVSKIFNIVWESERLSRSEYLIHKDAKVDLGPFEVKTTSTNTLRLREKGLAFDWAIAILCYHKYPLVELVGWIPIADARTRGVYNPRYNTYDIEQSKLNNMNRLKPFKDKLDCCRDMNRLHRVFQYTDFWLHPKIEYAPTLPV